MKESLKLGLFLAIVSAIAALSLSLTYTITSEKIAKARKAELNQALQTVLPQADSFSEKGQGVFLGLKQNKVIGFCAKVGTKGYSGPIEMIVGTDLSGKVTGVQILLMTETPGLGLNASAPSFLNQFIGKTSGNKIMPKDDIVALTGATITSNAVALGVKEALQMFIENKELLK